MAVEREARHPGAGYPPPEHAEPSRGGAVGVGGGDGRLGTPRPGARVVRTMSVIHTALLHYRSYE